MQDRLGQRGSAAGVRIHYQPVFGHGCEQGLHVFRLHVRTIFQKGMRTRGAQQGQPGTWRQSGAHARLLPTARQQPLHVVHQRIAGVHGGDLPAQFESLGATESNVGRMRAAGVQVALASTGNNGGEHNLRQYAGNLVAITRVPGHTGLTWGEALAAITSGPAAALGMDNELGSLRAGRRADVVLWDGDPLEIASAPTAVWIDGQPQPMRSRQSQLRDRYLVPTEGALPKAYER